MEEGIIAPPTNEAHVGVTGSKQDGVALEGGISKDLGGGKSIEADGKIAQKKGWSFGAFFKWGWK